jgi:drug/metabolite transporter (DMT)-like permease
MDSGWEPLVVAFYRGAVGLAVVLIWLALRWRNSGLFDYRVWLWSSVAGLGVAGNFAFYFLSITESSIAVAATLMYCAPIFVYLVSFALQFERPTAFKRFAIALVMIGIGLLTKIYDLNATDMTLLGVIAGLLSGLSYAVFIFGFKYAAPYGSPQTVLSIALTVLTVILVFPSNIIQATEVLYSEDLALFIGLGLIGAGFPFVFYIYGLKNTAPAVASVVAMVEPVTASLFGVVIMNEVLAGPQILGMVLILITVTALSVYSNTKHPGYVFGKPWRALKSRLWNRSDVAKNQIRDAASKTPRPG